MSKQVFSWTLYVNPLLRPSLPQPRWPEGQFSREHVILVNKKIALLKTVLAESYSMRLAQL